jgi:hypothetical protein
MAMVRWSTPRTPDPDLFTLDTLGKLRAHGHGVCGYCRDCRCIFAVSNAELIAERGAECRVVGMAPLTCPGCGGKHTTFSTTVLRNGR